jgi:hypothetical protein
MADAVEPGEVLVRSLAEHAAYWDAQGTLTKAQRRWSTFERELRTNLAAKGRLPNPKIIAMVRSGEWERRQRQNMRNLLHNQARLARLKREGYSFDAEHRLVAPAVTRIHAPARRVNRERRPAGRSRARAPSGDDPSPESDPPLRVIPYATFRRVLRRALGEQV